MAAFQEYEMTEPTDEEVIAQVVEDLEPSLSDKEWTHPAALEPLQLWMQSGKTFENMTVSQFRRYLRDVIRKAECGS